MAEVSLSKLALPARMVTYRRREGIGNLGQLVAVDRARLDAAKNLARKTIAQSAELIREFVETHETRRAAWSQGLLASWKDWMRDLDTIPRMILGRNRQARSAPGVAECVVHADRRGRGR